MHPEREQLKRFVEKRLDQPKMVEISRHLTACELCREFCENYRVLMDSLNMTKEEKVPPSGWALADRLYQQAIRGRVIPLIPLLSAEADSILLLAADGEKEQTPGPQNLTTQHSTDPEVVLRVMRDPVRGDYLQLISEDTNLVSGVMVELPELGREYITDKSGHADLDDISTEEYDKLKWQVKMSGAIFDLESLAYDPDSVEYAEETIIETENRDKIQVTFAGKTEGKQITLRVLELDGNKEFGSIKVVVSQEKSRKSFATRPDQSITFEIAEPGNAIDIRIFY